MSYSPQPPSEHGRQPAPLNYAPVPMQGRRSRTSRGQLGWALFIICLAIVFMLLPYKSRSYVRAPLSDFRNDVLTDNVTSVTIEGDDLTWQVRSYGTRLGTSGAVGFRTPLPTGTGDNWAFTQWVLESAHGATVRVENGQNLLTTILPYAPWLLIFGYLFAWQYVARHQPPQVAPQWPAGYYPVPSQHQQGAAAPPPLNPPASQQA
jgi:hypothetical protein